jgi:hypothetical protein
VQEELSPSGFTVLAVALDRSAEDVRPFVEAARPSFPVLLDADHVVADLYRVINVPSGVWIDERGRVVRPVDVAFANNMFRDMHGIDAEPHLAGLRAWAREGVLPFDERSVRDLQVLPTAEEQLARAEFALAVHLQRSGRPEAAERHFARADSLAPHDFTIRRGSMPMRGKDPFGADFADVYSEWIAAGRPYYRATKPTS